VFLGIVLTLEIVPCCMNGDDCLSWLRYLNSALLHLLSALIDIRDDSCVYCNVLCTRLNACGICNDVMLLLRRFVFVSVPSLSTALDLILMQNCARCICTK